MLLMIKNKYNVLILALIMILIGVGAWAIQAKIAKNTQKEVSRSLITIRDTTHLAVNTWFENHMATGDAWANAKEIQALTAQLLTLDSNKTNLLNSPAQKRLREWFQIINKTIRYRGYFIVDSNNINLASSRNQNVGVKNLLKGQKEFLKRIWSGKSGVSLPVKSDVFLPNSQGELEEDLTSMFVASPIHNNNGEIIAIFMFRLDPEEGFTNILSQGRMGNTGETYAFDHKGVLISNSRFDPQLRKIGVIATDEKSILNVQLRDPGVNLLEGEKTPVSRSKQPFTFMATSALQGITDININQYRDYRGVPVVGAWVWDSNIGMGIVTEIDVEEAYQALRASQLAIIGFTLFSFFLLFGLAFIYLMLIERKRIEIELRLAATIFDNTDEGIVVTDAKAKIILINKAFSSITGYEMREVLGKNPRIQQSGRHNQSFYKEMWGSLKKEGHWRGQIWNRKKNGDIYPAWENINVVKNGNGKITNYVAIFSDISVLKKNEDRLNHLAHHDNLTGLPNRLRFMANLEQTVEIAKRRTHKVALMFLDLDGFKIINDTQGHDSGDELLIKISERLKSSVRSEDTVARLGGDEFTVILSEIKHVEDAGIIAEKILKAIRKPINVGDRSIDISISIGISIYPDDAQDYKELIKTADNAMYMAKKKGKNQYSPSKQ